MDLVFGLSKNQTQYRDLGYVPETSELLESCLRTGGQSLELPLHEIDDVVGVALGANPTLVPDPACRIPVEPEQPFFRQRCEELDCEKRISAGLLVNQLCQRTSGVPLAA